MGMGQCVCLGGHVFGGDFPDQLPADPAGGVLSEKIPHKTLSGGIGRKSLLL